ncbi:TPA: testis-specific protein-like [Bos taurus]|nr:TPA: testis-specific protein-like [Bos taurus]
MQTTSDAHHNKGPRAMSLSDGMAKPDDISGGQLPEWLLDLKQNISHPQVSVLISNQDQDFLRYMIDLNVQVRNHLQSPCKLVFSFQDNSYFLNTMIIKEYYLDITGYRACHSTPVHWFWDFEWGSPSHSLDTRSLNFLNWLSGHNGPESNRIADLISNDVWDDPLKYYLREEGSSIRDN